MDSTTPEYAGRLAWDIGTAYDLFASLHVLHHPDRFGLRPSWAAGVRSRLSPADRQILETAQMVITLPARWLHGLPAPRSALSALGALQGLPPEQRLPVLAQGAPLSPETWNMLRGVAERRAWGHSDLSALREFFIRHPMQRPKSVETVLDTWAGSRAFGEAYLLALQAYQGAFFAEEEQHLLPALQSAVSQAQRWADSLPVLELLDKLSQGVRFEAEFARLDIVLIPSYWITPLVYVDRFDSSPCLLVFGARSPDASLVPGELVPDALLHGLKALADPTRLRILRLLASEPLTLAQLARRLRLRPPTLLHHLSALRLAGLVHLTLDSGEDRRYTTRREALPDLWGEVEGYLSQPATTPIPEE